MRCRRIRVSAVGQARGVHPGARCDVRFPGCEEPAQFCDVDHTIPYPVGPTHPSNLKLVCRKHHLLKTFWTGIGGWADQQLPDGTVVWTAPTGRQYKTLPGSRLFFPGWDTTTAELPKPSGSVAPVGDHTLMMPKRRRTRAADRAKRIQQQRQLNVAARAKRAQQAAKTAAAPNKPPPPQHDWDYTTSDTADDGDPPPF